MPRVGLGLKLEAGNAMQVSHAGSGICMLESSLLLPRVCVSRKLEASVNPGLPICPGI